MKYWQLVSIINNQEILRRVALRNKKWEEFATWVDEFYGLIPCQDRSKFKDDIADNYVEEVLSATKGVVYLSCDGLHVRSYRISFRDKKTSLVAAYHNYGGEISEDIFEKGSVNLPR